MISVDYNTMLVYKNAVYKRIGTDVIRYQNELYTPCSYTVRVGDKTYASNTLIKNIRENAPEREVAKVIKMNRGRKDE